MVGVGSEVVLLAEQGVCRFEVGDGDLAGLATSLAHQMLVIAIDREVPCAGLPATQMHMVNQPDPFELVECSVDGRCIDPTGIGSYTLMDRRCGEELIIATGENPAYRSPSHGHPQARLPNQIQ